MDWNWNIRQWSSNMNYFCNLILVDDNTMVSWFTSSFPLQTAVGCPGFYHWYLCRLQTYQEHSFLASTKRCFLIHILFLITVLFYLFTFAGYRLPHLSLWCSCFFFHLLFYFSIFIFLPIRPDTMLVAGIRFAALRVITVGLPLFEEAPKSLCISAVSVGSFLDKLT